MRGPWRGEPPERLRQGCRPERVFDAHRRLLDIHVEVDIQNILFLRRLPDLHVEVDIQNILFLGCANAAGRMDAHEAALFLLLFSFYTAYP